MNLISYLLPASNTGFLFFVFAWSAVIYSQCYYGLVLPL